MKKRFGKITGTTLLLTLIATVVINICFGGYVYADSVGSNVTATFNSSTGVLTISSTGSTTGTINKTSFRSFLGSLDKKAVKTITFTNKVYAPADSSHLFDVNGMNGASDWEGLGVETFNNMSNLDVSNVTDMSYMFKCCNELQTLDLSGWNTANLVNMTYMFQHCDSITSINFTNFNTSNVTSMADMFWYCEKLTSLDLRSFNTSKVTNMGGMFLNCESLTSIDISNFNTSNVTNMSGLFKWCEKAQSINLGSSFNTSKVTNMSDMFAMCYALQTIDLSKFSTSQVTNMNSMFESCRSLTSLQLSRLNTSNVTDMSDMLSGLRFTTLDVSSLNTSKVINMSGMFRNCNNLTNINFGSHFDTSKVTNMYGMFESCYKLESLNLSGFDTSNVTSINYMFEHCRSLVYLNLSSFDTSKVTSMYELFYDCTSLKDINFGNNFNTSAVNSYDGMREMFKDCEKLTNLDLSFFDTSNVLRMYGMFENCKKLETLNLSGWDAKKLVRVDKMFYGCSKLRELNLTGFEISVEDNYYGMQEMFSGCSSLQSIDLSGFDTSKVGNMSNMFYGCESLTTLDLSSFDTSKVTKMNLMFANCYKLTNVDLSSFNTVNTTSMANMFNNCKSLGTINMYSFDITNLTNTEPVSMFSGCESLNNIFMPVTVKTISLPGTYYNKTNPADTNRYTQVTRDSFSTPVQLSRIFTVSYNSNEGLGSMDTQYKKENESVTVQEYGFTKPEGGEFYGWNTNKNGFGTAYQPGDEISLNKDIVLYAQYAFENENPELKKGDYVKYNTGNPELGENGYLLCRILYDPTSEYGIQLIPVNNVEKVMLGYKDGEGDPGIPETLNGASEWTKSKWSYNNMKVTLNNATEKYKNSKLATDVRSVGSDPTIDENGLFTLKNSETETAATYQFTYTGAEDITNMKDKDETYLTDYNALRAINAQKTGEKYWFASRDTNDNAHYKYMGNAASNEYGNKYLEFYCAAYENPSYNTYSDTLVNYTDACEFGIRPVIAIRSDIQIGNGLGTEGNAYDILYGAAKIGLVRHETLQDAINAAPTDGTETEIVLLSDVVENIRVENNRNIVLDLNGKTLTGDENSEEPTIFIDEGSKLTIKGDGKVHSENGTAIENRGELIIESGEITNNNADKPTIDNFGDLTMNGGKVENKAGGTAILNEEDGTVTINDGEVIGEPAIDNSNGGEVTISDDATITGTVTKADYTVVFKNNEQVVDTQKVRYGESVTPPTLTRPGYTLSWDKDLTSVTEDMEVNAAWTANTDTPYKIEYYIRNKDEEVEGYDLDSSLTVNKTGTTDTAIEITDADIKDLEGFTYLPTNSNNVLSGTINGNGTTALKLYYTRNYYSIDYELNGGSGENLSNSYMYGKEFVLSRAITKEGFTFEGWYNNPNFIGEEIKKITEGETGAKKFYAKWKQEEQVKLGDLNGDGNVSLLDLSLINQAIVGKITLNDKQKKAADINKDGKVTLIDLSLINQAIVGKITLSN